MIAFERVGLHPSNMKSRVYLGILLLLLPSLVGCLGDDTTDAIFGQEHGVPGGLTLACLKADKFTKMVIEIDYEAGYKPETSSTDMLKTRLGEVCDKPDGIEVKFTETNFAHEGSWSADDVREKGWDSKWQDPMTGSTLTWQLIFPSGKYSDDSVLGVAVDASTIAIFGDSIEDADGPFGRPSAEDVENSVLVHEAGHLLGLVNLVYTSPVDHEDSSHPGHSNNEDSVMYWAVESTDLMNFITGSLPTEFDQDDKDDLAGLKSGDIAIKHQLWS